MDILIRAYTEQDVPRLCEIWNGVVEEGVTFPQTEAMGLAEAGEFFAGQTFTGVAENAATGEVLGLYILHPNNVGRCSHIANAGYMVAAGARGMRIGEKLVKHSLETAAAQGFAIMQFNAVVANNHYALRLYQKLGFVALGAIPKGFLLKDGHYEDIVVLYKTL